MKKIKTFIKKNPEPAGPQNVNPSQLGQYSAQNQIAEGSALDTYLSSKGIDSKSLSRETKIGHANSSQFAKWKRDHMNEDMTVGRSSGSDIRSKQAHSPTRERADKLKKAMSHYKIKSVTTHMQLHGDKKEGNQMSAMTPEEVQMEAKKLSSYEKLKRGLKKGGFDIDAVDKKIADSKERQAKQRSDWDEYEKSKMKKEEVKTYMALRKEDMHDWEKEDKSIKTYGKKPKFDKTDKDDNIGEKKPSAAAIMSGGTTLTGEKRDTIEIDPMMRNRPGQPDVTKKKDGDKKDDKKDDKKQDKK